MVSKTPKPILIFLLISIFSLFSLACDIGDFFDELLGKNAVTPFQGSAPVPSDSNGNAGQQDSQADPVVRSSGRNSDRERISWSGPAECGDEVDESANWRWRVSLMPDGKGGMVGTIHFHDCPGGGRVAFHVTLVSESEDGVLSLVGERTGGDGALAYDDPTIPDSEHFTVKIGEAPFPNFSE